MHHLPQMAPWRATDWRAAAARMAAGALLLGTLAGCASVSSTWSTVRGQLPWGSQAAPVVPHVPALQATHVTERWHGLYLHEGEVARFTECKSGQSVAVLMAGDSALLENAYHVSRNGAATPMLAAVDGRLVERAVADPVLARQGATELGLQVERFVSLSSASACAGKAGGVARK